MEVDRGIHWLVSRLRCHAETYVRTSVMFLQSQKIGIENIVSEFLTSQRVMYALVDIASPIKASQNDSAIHFKLSADCRKHPLRW